MERQVSFSYRFVLVGVSRFMVELLENYRVLSYFVSESRSFVLSQKLSYFICISDNFPRADAHVPLMQCVSSQATECRSVLL